MGSRFSWRPAGHPQRPGEDNSSLRVFFSCFLRRSRAGHDRDAEPGFVRAARHSGHAQRIFQNRRVGGSKNTDPAGDRREGAPRWRGRLHFGLGATVQAAMTGAPIKVVAAMVSRPLHVLISRPAIRIGRDLKGKTLGVDSAGSRIDYLSRLAVRYLGLDPDRDVKIIDTGESFLRVAALKDGSIDATAVDVALAVKAEEEGMTRLLHLGDIINLPISGIAVASARLATHREQIKKFIQATFRGARFIKQKRSETIRIIQSQLRVTS